ncbi:MAG: hypothetical protein ACKOX2_18640, partial [Microcystaceae cyanobacterium]
MAQEMPTIFGKTRFVIAQMEEFLDKILEGAIAFKLGVINYIKQEAVDESCEQKLSQLIVIKNRSNDLRKLIGVELYTEILIPDSRGDVL